MTTAVLRIQGQRWPRCRDRATYPRRPEQSSGPFPGKLVHLCHWSSVTVSFAAPKRSSLLCRWRGFRHPRENGLTLFRTSARLWLPALSSILP